MVRSASTAVNPATKHSHNTITKASAPVITSGSSKILCCLSILTMCLCHYSTTNVDKVQVPTYWRGGMLIISGATCSNRRSRGAPTQKSAIFKIKPINGIGVVMIHAISKNRKTGMAMRCFSGAAAINGKFTKLLTNKIKVIMTGACPCLISNNSWVKAV